VQPPAALIGWGRMRPQLADAIDVRWTNYGHDMSPPDIATVEGLRDALQHKSPVTGQLPRTFGLHCNSCGGTRHMTVFAGAVKVENLEPGNLLAPMTMEARCPDCGAYLWFVIHERDGRIEVATLSERPDNGRLPSAPTAVRYYLDQADRALSFGAYSAAAAMYRSTLEHVLHDQGFTTGTLGIRLRDLLAVGTPPAWLVRLTPELLSLINKLGNGAIHANDGDVARQAVLDLELCRLLRDSVGDIVFDIYERERVEAERIQALQAAAAQLAP
jgi:hypothetical protein